MKPAPESLFIFHRYVLHVYPTLHAPRRAAVCISLELSGGYSAALLHLLDDRDNLLEKRV
jgi:hypothetical protein